MSPAGENENFAADMDAESFGSPLAASHHGRDIFNDWLQALIDYIAPTRGNRREADGTEVPEPVLLLPDQHSTHLVYKALELAEAAMPLSLPRAAC